MSLWQFLAQTMGWVDAHTPPDKRTAAGMSAERFKELRAAYG